MKNKLYMLVINLILKLRIKFFHPVQIDLIFSKTKLKNDNLKTDKYIRSITKYILMYPDKVFIQIIKTRYYFTC